MAKKIKQKTLQDLNPNKENPRTISDEKLEMLKAAVNEFGDLGGFVFNTQTKRMVSGHQRAKIIPQKTSINIEKRYDKPTRTGTTAEGSIIYEGEKFKYREVMWDEAKEKAAAIAANSHAGEWDVPQLSKWLKDIDSFGMNLDLTLFNFSEREDLFERLTDVSAHTRVGKTGVDEDETPEPPRVPKSKLGDLYLLGEHRLLCGDSTDAAQVARLMKSEKADLVFTDPPYGVNYDGGHANTKRREKLANDHNVNIYGGAVPQMKDFSKPKAALYLWFAATKGLQVLQVLQDNGYGIRSWIIWNKNMAQFGAIGAQYKQKHEPCLYAFKSGEAPFWDGPTNEVSVWDEKRASKNEFHPTQKPVELAERAIRNSCPRDGYVLDLFGGSGSTIIAAEKTNRKCFMMELEPIYIDVIIERWEKYTGKKAKLIVTHELNKKPKLKSKEKTADIRT